MAKAKLIEQEDTKQWKPFVSVELSKREAAGLAALLYVTNEYLVRGNLYYTLEKVLKSVVDSNDLDVYTDGLTVSGSTDVQIHLDGEFGEV